MAYFWINNHSINSLFLNRGCCEKGFVFSKENVIQISLELHKLGVTEIELCEWCKFTSDYSIISDEEAILVFDLIQSFFCPSSISIDYRYIIIFLLIQTYHPYTANASQDYASLIKTHNRLCSEDNSRIPETDVTKYAFELVYNSRLVDRTSFFFDNLLVIFVCLFFDNQNEDSIDLIIDNAFNGNYSFFIPLFHISASSLPFLSFLFSCGTELGESQEISSVVPSSYINQSTQLYSPFDLIIFIENHMSCLPFHTLITHNLTSFQYYYGISNKEYSIHPIESTPSIAYYIHCYDCIIDDCSQYDTIVIEDCSHCSFQLGIIKNIVIVRNCQDITLSTCSKRLFMDSCQGLLTYVYACSNPIYVNTPLERTITAPYNIPQPQIQEKLEKAGLTGRNCWDLGVDLRGVHFPCARLPPSLFTPFVSHPVLDSEQEKSNALQLPLLPKEYEDVFIQVFNSMKSSFGVCSMKQLNSQG